MKRLLILAALVVSCASPSPTAHTLTGSMILTDFDSWSPWVVGNPCSGEGGYDDIGEGTDVVVRDEAGEIIATGGLQAGTLVDNGQCEFAFTVADVPDATFYAIEVSHRGELTYSSDELETMGWEVGFTLGGD